MEEASAIAAAAASRARFERGERFPTSETDGSRRVRAHAALVITGIAVLLTLVWELAVIERWIGFPSAYTSGWAFDPAQAGLIAGGVTASVAAAGVVVGRRARETRPSRRTTVTMAWVAGALAATITAPLVQRPFGSRFDYYLQVKELPRGATTALWLVAVFTLGGVCSLLAGWFVCAGIRGPLSASVLAMLAAAWVVRGSGLTSPRWKSYAIRGPGMTTFANVSLSPWLLAGGAALIALASLALVLGRRSRTDAVRGTSWLLVLVALLIGLVALQIRTAPTPIMTFPVDIQ